jgi:hypothetical protein
VEAARAALGRAAALDPESVAVAIHRGRAAALAGRWRAERGGNPAADFAEAERRLEGARAAAPDEPLTHVARAEAALWRARWLSLRGLDSGAETRAGLEAAGRALAVNSRLTAALLARAGLRLVEAAGAASAERIGLLVAIREDLAAARAITTRPGADAAVVEGELARFGE